MYLWSELWDTQNQQRNNKQAGQGKIVSGGPVKKHHARKTRRQSLIKRKQKEEAKKSTSQPGARVRNGLTTPMGHDESYPWGTSAEFPQAERRRRPFFCFLVRLGYHGCARQRALGTSSSRLFNVCCCCCRIPNLFLFFSFMRLPKMMPACGPFPRSDPIRAYADHDDVQAPSGVLFAHAVVWFFESWAYCCIQGRRVIHSILDASSMRLSASN